MDDRPDLPLLPAAVSPLVAAEVAGPPRRCRVLGAFPSCLYVDLGSHDRVLAVLASDAVALPIGLVVAKPSGQLSWGVDPGAHVVLGGGRVRLPRAEVVAARLLPAAGVRPAARGTVSPEALPGPGVLGELARDLTAAALAGQPVEAGVRGLVGVGRGLTPSGDDALCGVLLTLAALDGAPAQQALAVVRAAVRGALPRTTSLSAALLGAAGVGYAVPDVVRLVTWAVSGGSTDRNEAGKPARGLRCGAHVRVDPPSGADLVERVLAIGHTSGRDLLSGVAGALAAVDAYDPAKEGAPRG